MKPSLFFVVVGIIIERFLRTSKIRSRRMLIRGWSDRTLKITTKELGLVQLFNWSSADTNDLYAIALNTLNRNGSSANMRKRFRQRRQRTRKRQKRTGSRDSGGSNEPTITDRTRNAPMLALTKTRREAQTRRTRAASDLTKRDLIRRTIDTSRLKYTPFKNQLINSVP